MSNSPASAHAAQRMAWDRLWLLLLSDEPGQPVSADPPTKRETPPASTGEAVAEVVR